MSSSRKLLAAAILGCWALALWLPKPPTSGGVGKQRSLAWPPASFLCYYGLWDHHKIAQAGNVSLIIAHPGPRLQHFNADLVRRLRAGADGLLGNGDDRVLLAYLSLSEDEDPPRGPVPMASRYLDQERMVQDARGPCCDSQGMPRLEPGCDGIPDRNGFWGGYWVRPLDPGWLAILRERTQALVDMGVDGFMLDTLDVRPEFQEPMMALVERLQGDFPQHYWLANRGLELLRRFPQRYRAHLDGVVLESFFTHWDWQWGRAVVSPYLQDNLRRLHSDLVDVPKFYLDYLDPDQPDRGGLLALRPPGGFWTSPWLDRFGSIDYHPHKLSLPRAQLDWTPLGLAVPAEPCQAMVTWRGQDYPLPELSGPWALGAAESLRIRRVDFEGGCSEWLEVPLPVRPAQWSAAWRLEAGNDWLELSWDSPEPAQLWLGEAPGQIGPHSLQGKSPLRLVGLEADKLYWVSLSHPGGQPDRVQPIRTHDVLPPASPQALKARWHGGYLTLTWEAVSAPDLAGYRVYLGQGLPYEIRGQCHFELALKPASYRVWVTSFDQGNHESPPAQLTLDPSKEKEGVRGLRRRPGTL